MIGRQERRLARLPQQIILEYNIGPNDGFGSIGPLGDLFDRLRDGEKRMHTGMTLSPEVKTLAKKEKLYVIFDDERARSKMTVEAVEEFLLAGAIPERVREIYPLCLEDSVDKTFRRRGYELQPRFLRKFLGYDVQPVQRPKIISLSSWSSRRRVS